MICPQFSVPLSALFPGLTMNLPLPHWIFLCGLALYVGLRAFYQIQAARQQKTVSKASLKDWLLVVFIAVSQVVMPLLLFFSTWLNAANYTLPQAALWCGVPVLVGGLWMFWRSHADLGKNWSVTLELNPDHKLITQGVYRSIRHPMYASFFLLAISQVLLLNNWLAGWSALAATTLLYVVRRPHEEQMMLECFGDEYRTYLEGTGGVIPRWRATRSGTANPD